MRRREEGRGVAQYRHKEDIVVKGEMKKVVQDEHGGRGGICIRGEGGGGDVGGGRGKEEGGPRKGRGGGGKI